MQYREDKASGNMLSALGFGCMRFPRDKAETERMILSAIDGGVNFFDTAYAYQNSEVTLGEIIAKHNKRKDIYIATKLPYILCKNADDFDKYFNEQLRRLQTDYVDYYFIHGLSDYAGWDVLRKMNIEHWIAEKRESGKIKHIGFSLISALVVFFMNPMEIGWAMTFVWFAIILVVVAVLGFLLVSFDRVHGRKATAI